MRYLSDAQHLTGFVAVPGHRRPPDIQPILVAPAAALTFRRCSSGSTF